MDSELLQQMYNFETGLLVDPLWFKVIRRKNKPHRQAVELLALIFYHYLPIAVSDGKDLKMSYSEIEDFLDMGRSELMQAFKTLGDYGVVKREFKIEDFLARKLPNVMFIRLYPEALKNLIDEYKIKAQGGIPPSLRGVSPQSSGGCPPTLGGDSVGEERRGIIYNLLARRGLATRTRKERKRKLENIFQEKYSCLDSKNHENFMENGGSCPPNPPLGGVPPNPPLQSATPPVFAPDRLELVDFLFEKVKELSPKAVQTNAQRLSWAKVFDLMIRKDGLEVQEIWEMIEWVHNDDFWKANILSPSKLRKQWHHLTAKRNLGKRSPEVRAREQALLVKENQKFTEDLADRLEIYGDKIFLDLYHVMIKNSLNNSWLKIEYREKGFREQLESALRKFGYWTLERSS